MEPEGTSKEDGAPGKQSRDETGGAVGEGKASCSHDGFPVGTIHNKGAK